MSETPEIYGAEHLLTRRAVSQKVGQKLIDRICWWEEYTAQHNAEIDNNPSPGNKAGGLTTIEEMGQTIFRLILDTASGKKSKSENFGFGANEFVPWHLGAIL